MIRTVIHLSDSHDFGGTEQIILQLIAGLDSRRWRSVLMHQPVPGVAPLVNGARSLGCEHIALRSSGGLAGLARVPAIVRRFRSLEPAAVHAHLTDPLSCKFGLIAAALARVPAVVATAQLFMELPNARALVWQHRIITGAVDRYIAVSNEVASKLQVRFAVPRRKVRVVHNGIPLERFGLTAGAHVRTELMAGADSTIWCSTVARLDPQKGHRYLLEAIVEVPDALFVLAGDGPERASLEQEARALGIEDRVRFLGRRDDISDCWPPAICSCCHRSTKDCRWRCSKRWHPGKPVVATAIGGTDEAVIRRRNRGPGDTRQPDGAWNGDTTSCLGNPALGSALGAAGRARVSASFSSQAMVAGVTAVYDELLQ